MPGRHLVDAAAHLILPLLVWLELVLEELVDRLISGQLEHEEVLQTLESNRAQSRQSQQKLGESSSLIGVLTAAVDL